MIRNANFDVAIRPMDRAHQIVLLESKKNLTFFFIFRLFLNDTWEIHIEPYEYVALQRTTYTAVSHPYGTQLIRGENTLAQTSLHMQIPMCCSKIAEK